MTRSSASSGRILLLTIPPVKSSHSKLFARAPEQAGTCADSVEACQRFAFLFLVLMSRTFFNCSNHGTCVAKTASKGAKPCFVCACTGTQWTDDFGKPVEGYSSPVKWGGDSCQYQDISTSFQIVFWVAFGLIVLLMCVFFCVTDE